MSLAIIQRGHINGPEFYLFLLLLLDFFPKKGFSHPIGDLWGHSSPFIYVFYA